MHHNTGSSRQTRSSTTNENADSDSSNNKRLPPPPAAAQPARKEISSSATIPEERPSYYHRLRPRSYFPKGFVPSHNHIMCGRGRGCSQHEGNKRFSEVVRSNMPRYAEAPKRVDKSTVIASLVESIYASGGVFIKFDREKNQWYDIGIDGAREKCGHAIRDLLVLYTKASQGMKGKRGEFGHNSEMVLSFQSRYERSMQSHFERKLSVSSSSIKTSPKHSEHFVGPPSPVVTSNNEMDASVNLKLPGDAGKASTNLAFQQQRLHFQRRLLASNSQPTSSFLRDDRLAREMISANAGDDSSNVGDPYVTPSGDATHDHLEMLASALVDTGEDSYLSLNQLDAATAGSFSHDFVMDPAIALAPPQGSVGPEGSTTLGQQGGKGQQGQQSPGGELLPPDWR